ncbi:tetratricopeptide repeat protein, partial [Synechocystis salina LEGE 06155]|nr:tetratricopeptide repeat protein [Synechocystis salina LEGE 06155]
MRTNWLGFSLGVFLFGFGCFPVEIVAQEQEEILLEVQGTLEPGDIELSGETLLDVHPIEIKKDGPLYISVESDQFDSYLMLLDEEVKKVAENDNFQGYNAGILLESLQPGYYEIGVMGVDKDSTLGNYLLTVKHVDDRSFMGLQASYFYNNGFILHNKGSRGKSLEAIDSFEKALVLYIKINDSFNEANTINSIGYVYSGLGQNEKALEYY